MTQVSVGPDRVLAWLHNFGQRHGATAFELADGALRGRAEDDSWFLVRLPFGRVLDEPEAASLPGLCAPPDAWGVLLVRKGGFAVAALAGPRMVSSKVGQRHVQGRSKAGGQSQQRFARRRDNQARIAYEAAAGHAAEHLGAVPLVVTGGDHAAVDAVLADRRLAHLSVLPPWLPVPDPRRAVLERAVRDAGAVRIEVTDTLRG